MRAFPVVGFVIFAAITAGIAALHLASTHLGAAPPPRSPPGASAASGPVRGEHYLWRPVAIGGGGFVTGMSMDAAGRTRVVRSDVHGAYIWNAGLRRWTQLVVAAAMPVEDRRQAGMNQGAYEITVAPGDARRLYLAIRDRVYRSDDGGATWTLPPGSVVFPHDLDANSASRANGSFMAVSPDDPNLLFVGTIRDGLWRSTDGAATWARVAEVPVGAAPAAGIVVWFGPRGVKGRAPRVMAAVDGGGVFVANDPRGPFVPLTPPGARRPLGIGRVSYAAQGDMFATDPRGRTAWRLHDGIWTDLRGTGLPEADYIGVAASPWAIYLGDGGGRIWCSANGGKDWARQSRSSSPGRGEPPWLHVADLSFFSSGQLQFDTAVPGRLWVMSGTGPYRADVGTSGCSAVRWQSEVNGIEELVANDVIQAPGHAPLFAAWDFGIHRKPDLNAFSTTYGPKERVLIAAQQLDWSPADPAFIVTNASDTRTTCCSEDGDAVLAGYSTDGGGRWHKFASLPVPPGTAATDPWRMSFGTIAVSATNVDDIVWEPAFNRSPFVTLDRGATWRRVVLKGEVLPFTGSYENFYGARKTLAADRVRPGTFYLVHSGAGANAALAGLWRSTDGGIGWRRVFAGEIAPDSRHSAKLRAVPGKAGHLFFTSGVAGGPDTVLRRSTDGGEHWRPVEGVDRVDDVAFGKAASGQGYPTIFLSGRVAGQYGVWRSTDDAAHWQRVAGFPMGRLDQVSVVEADKDVFGRVYVGYIGSGWLYGEPAPCSVRAAHRDAAQCVPVR
jgi:photosystem II stability/assembly factor-like uncharacterized protein